MISCPGEETINSTLPLIEPLSLILPALSLINLTLVAKNGSKLIVFYVPDSSASSIPVTIGSPLL